MVDSVQSDDDGFTFGEHLPVRAERVQITLRDAAAQVAVDVLAEHSQKVRDKGLAPLVDSPDDLYQTNIQISELNALNACLAVIRFKQLRGFYFEEIPYYHLLLELGDLQIVGESELSED